MGKLPWPYAASRAREVMYRDRHGCTWNTCNRIPVFGSEDRRSLRLRFPRDKCIELCTIAALAHAQLCAPLSSGS